MTRRFYVEPPALESDEIALDGALAHRLAKVLRLRTGDDITLFDGSGVEVRATLEHLSDKRATAAVSERSAGLEEPRVAVHLYQSITKGERFEWLLEKGTEIGVASFTPMITARAVVKTNEGAPRIDRWRRIVVEAAEQCGRSAVPTVGAPLSFDRALSADQAVVLLPYEDAGAAAPAIAEALNNEIDALFAMSAVNVLIGPEGGYDPAEVEQATAAGAIVVTMGRRVLRSETAGLVAATLVLQVVGELG